MLRQASTAGTSIEENSLGLIGWLRKLCNSPALLGSGSAGDGEEETGLERAGKFEGGKLMPDAGKANEWQPDAGQTLHGTWHSACLLLIEHDVHVDVGRSPKCFVPCLLTTACSDKTLSAWVAGLHKLEGAASAESSGGSFGLIVGHIPVYGCLKLWPRLAAC